MSPEFLRAVVDTLLPGAEAQPGRAPLPSGSEAGLDLALYPGALRRVLDATAAAMGGATAFAGAAEGERVAVLRVVERDHPAAFRALVTALLADYCESPAVLTAFGWRTAPPQPEGHLVPEADAETGRRLDRVRQRAPLWRAPPSSPP
jgi:hypothetical protein